MTPEQQQLVALLPTPPVAMAFDAWKMAAAQAGISPAIRNWLALKHQGVIVTRNDRDPLTGKLVLMVSRA